MYSAGWYFIIERHTTRNSRTLQKRVLQWTLLLAAIFLQQYLKIHHQYTDSVAAQAVARGRQIKIERM